MTDLQNYTTMLSRAQIYYEQTADSGKTTITVPGGYTGFFSEHVFDANGKLIAVGAWE